MTPILRPGRPSKPFAGLPAAVAAVGALLLATDLHAQEPGGRTARQPADPSTDPVAVLLEDRTLVEKVTLRGVEAFDDDRVEAAIETRATRCRSVLFQPFCWFTEAGFFQRREHLDRDELPKDGLRIRVFYWLRGYRDAEVREELLPAEDGLEVRFTVDEGRPTVVRTVGVTQEDSLLLSPGEIRRARFPPAGRPLDMVRLRRAEETLRRDLRELGYANAVVEDSITIHPADADDGPPRADVRVALRPGRLVTIDGILVRGNDEVSEETIRRSLGLEIGQIFRESELEDARRRLYRSNLFRQSFVTTVEEAPGLAAATAEDAAPDSVISAVGADTAGVHPGDTTRTVLVVVGEAPFDEVGLAAGFSTIQFVQSEARYTRYNLFGGARRIDLVATAGNLLAPSLHDRPLFDGAVPRGVGTDVEEAFLDPTWSVSADFTQPWLFSADNSLALGLFARRRSVIGVVVDRSFGGSAVFTRTVARHVPVSLGYRFEETEVDAGGVYFCVNFGICESRTIAALQSRHRLSPLTLTARAERVDDPMDPHRGFMARFEAEHASALTLSDYRYSRVEAEGSFYRRVGPGVLAGRARFGWIDALAGTASALGVERVGTTLLHPRKRLYSGGSRSVRGYGENQLGPRVLTVAADRLAAPPDGDGGGAGCTEASIRDRSCDPAPLPSSAFQPRPLGGNQVIEGTLEYRVPFGTEIGFAVFVDAARVGDLDLNIPSGARSAVTPGFGVRYRSPVGMIRMDLGVRPALAESLPVITALGGPEDRELVSLETRKRYQPAGRSGGFLEGIYRRLVLHLSIGQAF